MVISAQRFRNLAAQLTSRIRDAAPAAILHIEEHDNAYCCISWRLNRCRERELFVEQPGYVIAPPSLRVGIYFQDAQEVTARPDSRQAALEVLAQQRLLLQRLGVSCTFTSGSNTRDDRIFGWSDQELTEWLTSKSENRDLVWRWDLREGEPSPQQFDDVLVALLAVWVVWNSL